MSEGSRSGDYRRGRNKPMQREPVVVVVGGAAADSAGAPLLPDEDRGDILTVRHEVEAMGQRGKGAAILAA